MLHDSPSYQTTNTKTCILQDNCSQYPELTAWTRRMRVARAQGAISEERIQVRGCNSTCRFAVTSEMLHYMTVFTSLSRTPLSCLPYVCFVEVCLDTSALPLSQRPAPDHRPWRRSCWTWASSLGRSLR